MPNQWIGGNQSIQPESFSLKAYSRGMGGDYIDWQEWRRQPGDVDQNTIQSALGQFTDDGDFAEVVTLDDCIEIKTIVAASGQKLKQQVKCEHWDRCKVENLSQCYKGQEKQVKRTERQAFMKHTNAIMTWMRELNEPTTLYQVLQHYGIDRQHLEFFRWRTAFFYLARRGRIVAVGRIRLAPRAQQVKQWVVKE